MKIPAFFAVLSLCSGSALVAQTYQADLPESKKLVLPEKPRVKAINRTVGAKVNYSGVAVHWAKLKYPAQTINPFAGSEAGDGKDNVAINAVTGEADGLKFFSIEF